MFMFRFGRKISYFFALTVAMIRSALERKCSYCDRIDLKTVKVFTTHTTNGVLRTNNGLLFNPYVSIV